MLYYKNNNGYVATTSPMGEGFESITKEEYDEYIASLEPTEEEVRTEKEALLAQLLAELHPDIQL